MLLSWSCSNLLYFAAWLSPASLLILLKRPVPPFIRVETLSVSSFDRFWPTKVVPVTEVLPLTLNSWSSIVSLSLFCFRAWEYFLYLSSYLLMRLISVLRFSFLFFRISTLYSQALKLYSISALTDSSRFFSISPSLISFLKDSIWVVKALFYVFSISFLFRSLKKINLNQEIKFDLHFRAVNNYERVIISHFIVRTSLWIAALERVVISSSTLSFQLIKLLQQLLILLLIKTSFLINLL